jgi:hypothetical protein
MDWRPIPPRDYVLSLVAGLTLGVVVAGAAIAAALLTA